jgi:hypothetical protein
MKNNEDTNVINTGGALTLQGAAIASPKKNKGTQ